MHSYDLAAHMPAHLAVMFSMSWIGIPASDPQGPGPDSSYGNAAVSFSCGNVHADPTACDSCILQGAGDVCLATGAPQRQFASRRRPLAGIYSASGRDVEGRRRIALELSAARRPCDDGAKLDVWAVQVDGTHNTSLYPGNPSCPGCDIAYHGLGAFLDEADQAQLTNAVMPSDDATWYFHFGRAAGLGTCDDSPGNPKQNCIDALTQDYIDMATLADAHPSALRIDGKPVLFTYFDPGYLSPTDWQTLLQNARDALHHDFYAIATIQAPSHAEFFAAFDALAPWIQLDWTQTSGSDLRSHAQAFTASEHEPLFSQVGLYPGRVVFGGVAPGFDDFTEAWGACVERQLPPGQPRDPAFLAGEFDYLRGKATRGLILETWDDWTEGTEFEPDVAGGTSMLVALRQQLGALYGEPADPAGDARLDQRWTQYGQARNCAGGPAAVPPETPLACPPPPPALDGGAPDLAGGVDGGVALLDCGGFGASSAQASGEPRCTSSSTVTWEEGGCAIAGAAASTRSCPWWLLCAIGAAWRWRRRRPHHAA